MLRLAATAAIARTTCKSFSTRPTPGSRSWVWTSRNSYCVSSLKPQLRVLIAEVPREPPLHAHGGIDRHLRRTALVVGALRIGRLPRDAELVERLPRGADEAAGGGQHRLAGETRGFRAAIDAVAEAHETALAHQAAQRAQHLVLAAEIAELARKEHLVPPAGDAVPDLLAQCQPSRHVPLHSLQKPDTNLYINPTYCKGNGR